MSEETAPKHGTTSSSIPVRLSVGISGGGHRATIWGLGALVYLVDAKLNHVTTTITSVSGGSILNAEIAASPLRFSKATQREYQLEAAKLAAQVAGFPEAMHLFRTLMVGWLGFWLLFGKLPIDPERNPFVQLASRLTGDWFVPGLVCLSLAIGSLVAYRRARLEFGYPLFALMIIFVLFLYWPFEAWAFKERDATGWAWAFVIGVVVPAVLAAQAAPYLRGTLWSWWGVWVYIALLAAAAFFLFLVWWIDFWAVLPWPDEQIFVAEGLLLVLVAVRLYQCGVHPVESRYYVAFAVGGLAVYIVALWDGLEWGHEAARGLTWVVLLFLVAEFASFRGLVAGRAFAATFAGIQHNATYGTVPGSRLPMPDAEALIRRRPWFYRVRLGEINNDVLHVFCATELTTQRPLFFTRDFAYNDYLGVGASRDFPLHTAVQASANLPGAFPVRLVTSSRLDFKDNDKGASSDLASRLVRARRLLLTDGGVFNNMADDWTLRLPRRRAKILAGLKRLRSDGTADAASIDRAIELVGSDSSPGEFLLVLNATRESAPSSKPLLTIPGFGELLHLSIASSVLYGQTNANRAEELIARFSDPNDPLSGAIVQIDQSPYDVADKIIAREDAPDALRSRAREAIEFLDEIGQSGLPPTEFLHRDGRSAARDARNHWRLIANTNSAVATTLDPLGPDVIAVLLQHSYVLCMVNIYVLTGWTAAVVAPPDFDLFRKLARGFGPVWEHRPLDKPPG